MRLKRRKIARSSWLLALLAGPATGCVTATQEQNMVDSGATSCLAENALTGTMAFKVGQGAACNALLPDGGPDLGAVVLQLSVDSISCEATEGSLLPVCSGAGFGNELYLEYGTVGSPASTPLGVGTWPATNTGGPWITTFFTDNLGAILNASGGQIVFTTFSAGLVAGTLDGLTFLLPDGGAGTLDGPFCTTFCGILTDGG